MVSSAPTIMQLWVQIPSTPSALFQFVFLKLWWEKDENKLKEARIGHLKKYYNTSLGLWKALEWLLFNRKQTENIFCDFVDAGGSKNNSKIFIKLRDICNLT